jgi:hypothetical protein
VASEGEDRSLGRLRIPGVANTSAIGGGGSSRKTPSRVRNESRTPTETCAGVRTARVPLFAPRVRSLAKAVTAEFTRRRANSRTASASTAEEANDTDIDSEIESRSDRATRKSGSGSSTIGVMAVLLLGHKTPAQAFFDSGKQRNRSGAIMQRTAIVRVGSVMARISRLDHGNNSFLSGVDWTGPFGRFCDNAEAMGFTSKSGRRDKGNEWQQVPLVGPSHELLLCATERGADSIPQAVQNVLIDDGLIRSDALFPEEASVGGD